MADAQDQPNSEPDGAPTPPEKQPPAKAVKKTAKAPTKKAPAKKPTAKKAPAKKPTAEKAPATRPGPAAKPETQAEQPLGSEPPSAPNGELAAAKDAAAQAKSTIEAANNPVSQGASATEARLSLIPLIVALSLSLLAILLIRQLRRR